MKIKAFYPVALFLTLCLACESQSSYNYSQESAATSSEEWRFQNVTNASSNDVVFQLPLPAGWQVVGPRGAGQAYVTGPQQVRVTSLPFETYSYGLNPMQAQAFQMAGQQTADPVPLQRIVEENLAPQIQQQGGRLTAQYPIPAIQEVDKAITELTVQAHGMVFEDLDMMATEWEAPNGMKSLILLTQIKIRTQTGPAAWQLCVEELEAPASSFEKAKETYLSALLNKQVDKQQIIASGRRRYQEHLNKMAQNQAMWNARMRNSAIAHQNRMASREAAFQASQARHRETVNAISDMSMKGYWERSAASDRMQNNTVNMIREENTVVNPHTGRNMQIEQGYNRTFVDPDGNYYQTDDRFFNPERHPQFRHYKEVKRNN